MQALIGLVVLVLDIIAILDVVKTQPTGGKKVLWVLLIVLLPIVGLVLYYLIGKKKTA